MTDVFDVTETKAELNHNGPQLNGFNGFTMMNRSFVVPTTKGPVTQIGLRYPTSITWRPKLLRASTPRQGGRYRVIYSHPTTISYPGGNVDQWVDLTAPLDLYANTPVYAAGYFAGAAAGSSGPDTLTTGRAQFAGDPTSGLISMTDYSVQANQDIWETPALGVRCMGEGRAPLYFNHFDSGDGWGTNATSVTFSDSLYSGSGWTADDHNHDANVGTLTLVLYKEGFEHAFPGNLITPIPPVIGSDFSGGLRLVMRARCGSNFSIGDGKWRVWMQSRHTDDPTKYANFMCNAIDNSWMLEDAQWHEFDQTLSLDPNDWTYAGGHEDTYLPMDFEDALRSVCNIHLPIVRPVGTPQPFGDIHVDYVGLTYTGGD